MHVDNKPFSLYVHIPYCISKCPYCDFNSHVVAQIPEAEYTNALLRELEHFGDMDDWKGRSIKSIFFGGGTPSTFKPQSIGKILAWAAATFPIEPDCEITLEANPGTVDHNNFFGYRDAGVNRISVGVQSFQPRLLKFLGRIHSADESRKALEVVRHAGFGNFSFDLIYANPGQTLQELQADLDTALEFQSPHLSAYNLTFEEGTPFHHEYRSGKMRSLSEDEEIGMAELIERTFEGVGLRRYEISNYARPGFHSRHNVNYWKGGDYLGLGAGAHSYKKMGTSGVLGRRWSNEKNPGRYITAIREKGVAVTDSEDIGLAKAAGEFMFLGLRMIEGISADVFCNRFGRSPTEFYPQIDNWQEGRLIEEKEGFLRLTTKGLMVANSIFVQFM
ncbi:MAG TPA: radical SAM family heme chaperone HemW [Methylomirabilota bacterium]|nr:radical SAM family heme chaperone HemW [Methylomirabilota bacterium]